MDDFHHFPFFIEAGQLVQASTATNANDRDFHFDLLSFLSIAAALEVDMVQITWQDSLASLGKGATSTVSQAQVDAEFNLAFKRSIDWPDTSFGSTDQQQSLRYKALIFELVALSSLSRHNCVVDLLGFTCEVQADTEQVWPVLLMERSVHGNMAEFLQSEAGATLDNGTKLKLSTDVARACLVLHELGIVHGDLKQENILIFPDGEGWSCKLIDFGYSCLGTSDDELVKVARTRPWQAPEHAIDQSYPFREARKMDVYSFGMLICRMFLSDELSANIGRVGYLQDKAEARELLDQIDAEKSTASFLCNVIEALKGSEQIGEVHKNTLEKVISISLQHQPESRPGSFEPIIAILDDYIADEKPATLSLATLNDLSHTVLNLGDYLADLDDTDYLLHRTLVKNLQDRVTNRRCECFDSATRQLWLCYEIGFGVPRNPERASTWLFESGNSQVNTSETLRIINGKYEARNPEKLLQRIGYETNLPFDPIRLYSIQNRLELAAQAFQVEVSGRKNSMGPQSRSFISQLSNLSLIYTAQEKLEQAEKASLEAVTSSREAFGMTDSETIGAENYYAYVLFKQGKWPELELLQLHLLPRKEEFFGPDDATTLNSQNYLVAAYYFQEQYRTCIDLAQDLVSKRENRLGKSHQETLVTKNWLCRALLQNSEQFDRLEDQTRELVSLSESACGKNDDATIERKEILATVLLGLSKAASEDLDLEKLNESMTLVLEVLDMCDNETPNLVLLIRAQLTLVCGLALQERLEDAWNELNEAMHFVNPLEEMFGSGYIEIRYIGSIEACLKALQLMVPQTSKEFSEKNTVQRKLARCGR